MPGRIGVAQRNRSPLCFVALDQAAAAPALQHRGELPGQVGDVVDAGVEAKAAVWGEQVDGVAGEQHPAVLKPLRDQEPARVPWLGADDLDRRVDADRALHGLGDLGFIDVLARLDGLVHHELVLAVERDDDAARVGIDREIHPGAPMSDELLDRRDAHVDRRHLPDEEDIRQGILAAEFDAETAPDRAAAAIATDKVLRTPRLLAAAVDVT